MAWTAPATFVVGAVLTAAQLNTNVRDNTSYLKGVIDGSDADNKIPDTALGDDAYLAIQEFSR